MTHPSKRDWLELIAAAVIAAIALIAVTTFAASPHEVGSAEVGQVIAREAKDTSQTCRFVTCPPTASAINQCPETVTHDSKAAAEAFMAALGHSGFYDCGGDEASFQRKRRELARILFGGEL